MNRAETPIKEDLTFSRYERGVAVFLCTPGEELRFDKASLIVRRDNLKKLGLPHDETQKAIANWPNQ